MNLTKLYEMQKALKDRIGYEEEDRFNKLILALFVEIGECANETRCFKFWSVKPSSEKKVVLEEYVDGLHFVLELGLEREETIMNVPYDKGWLIKTESITDQFNALIDKVGDFSKYRTVGNYSAILDLFLGLGEMLGFTWDEIEQAYLDKNKVNHERQDNGY